MLQSLRARLAFLFAGTLVLATVIASVVVVSLYQSYNRDQTEAELRKQVTGVATYYERAFNRTFKAGKRAPAVVLATEFEHVSDARLYYAGVRLFPVKGARNLKSAQIALDYRLLKPNSRPVYEFTPQGATPTYIGVG